MILLGGWSQDLFMCNGYTDFVPCVCDKLAKVCVCCVSCYPQVLFHVFVISWQKSVCAVFAVTFRFCSMCL